MRLIHLSEDLVERVLDGRVSPSVGLEGGCALALGSFDGLHLGHRELIAAVHQAQQEQGLAHRCLFTFRDHPRQVLNGKSPRLLTTWPEKLALLQDAGLDTVVAVEFCPALARLSYSSFVELFLIRLLGMRHMIGGYDVHLGADRGGTAQTLAALGQELGFGFTAVEALHLDDGRLISSSAIRAALDDGDVATPAAMLGRPYSLWGAVGYGDGIGDGLGFPTANLDPLAEQKQLPASGVYAVKVHLPLDAVGSNDEAGVLGKYRGALPEMDGAGELRGILDTERAVFRGMLNHGYAPTVHAGGLAEPRLEVHILDFSGYIRERSLKIEWIERLRGEKNFATVQELRDQLAADERTVRGMIR